MCVCVCYLFFFAVVVDDDDCRGGGYLIYLVFVESWETDGADAHNAPAAGLKSGNKCFLQGRVTNN